MTDPSVSPTGIALLPIVSFAVQQLLQVGDLAIVAIVKACKKQDGTFPLGLAEADLKKSVASLLSLALGLVATSVFEIKLLTTPDGALNTIVSALAVGAGTEGANSITKLLNYLKEGIKTKMPATKQGS